MRDDDRSFPARWFACVLLMLAVVQNLNGQSISDSHSTARLYPNERPPVPAPTPSPTIGDTVQVSAMIFLPPKWVLFARPLYARDDSVDLGGVYLGATYPGKTPFQVRLDYQRIWVRGGNAIDKFGVQAKIQRPFQLVTVSAQANYDDFRDSSQRYLGGIGFETVPFLAGLSAAGTLQWGHVNPRLGATRSGMIPTIELDYSFPRLSLATWYTFDNDVHLEDDIGAEASYTLSEVAAVGVGGGKHQTLYAYLQVKF
jgi:hypothetical protein